MAIKKQQDRKLFNAFTNECIEFPNLLYGVKLSKNKKRSVSNMGLDMYLFSYQPTEDLKYLSFNEILKMKDDVSFINDYEYQQKVLEDFEQKYVSNNYWNVSGETLEEKKERIRKEISIFLHEYEEEYKVLKEKTKFYPAGIEQFDLKEVGYWRKANQIHRWFVENIQDGIDECQYTVVDKDELQILYDICKNIVALVENQYSNSIENIIENDINLYNIQYELEDLLPTQAGFFFGSTNYDSWYLRDIVDTIKILGPIINEDDKETYYVYISSW